MTNFHALEEQVLFERQHCADKPNKCKAEIAVSVITRRSCFFFLFFFYWVMKIMEVEDVVTERYEKSVWRHGRCCVKVALNNFLFPVYIWSSVTLISELLQRNMLIQRCGVFNVDQCLTWFTFWSTEEEEEEEIVQPQPVNETQTEKPDQKEEEEGTTNFFPFNIYIFFLHEVFTKCTQLQIPPGWTYLQENEITMNVVKYNITRHNLIPLNFFQMTNNISVLLMSLHQIWYTRPKSFLVK